MLEIRALQRSRHHARHARRGITPGLVPDSSTGSRATGRHCRITPKEAGPSPWLLLRSTSSALVCDHADAHRRNERHRIHDSGAPVVAHAIARHARGTLVAGVGTGTRAGQARIYHRQQPIQLRA